MNVFTRLGQLMGDPRVTDFELHFFTAAFFLLAGLLYLPLPLALHPVLWLGIWAGKEFGLDKLRHPGEAAWIGWRDFSYYGAGTTAGLLLWILR